MQISLTKKLAEAMNIKPIACNKEINPLFCWTANWTNTFQDRKEDLVVLVNNATRFTVAIYGIRKNQFKDITEKIITAIRNIFLAMNINPEIIDEYFKLASKVEYTANSDKKLTAWVNSQGREAAFIIGDEINKSFDKIKYNDSMGELLNHHSVNYSKSYAESYKPAEKMIKALSDLTNKPIYNYRAYEILVTLDLEIYKATRRLIVPANIDFNKLHVVLQEVFNWKNYHLYCFEIYEEGKDEPVEMLTPYEEDLTYYDIAVKIKDQKLSDYFPKKIIYTYDMGDDWQHEIKFLRVIEKHDQESPYLLEAKGQTPPEDVGGIGGYIEFRNIMLNPKHPQYKEMKTWAGYWRTELNEWETLPRVIRR